MAIQYEKLQFISTKRIDKIVGSWGPITSTKVVAANSDDSLTVANPYGKRALPTMKWSIDGANFYPPRVKFPITAGVGSTAVGATAGVIVGETSIVFYFTNTNGSPVTFTVIWTLDFIDS